MQSTRPWYAVLYVQVLIGIVLGVIFGALLPDLAKSEWVEFLGKAFVKLIKMAIAPIIFCTIVSGISHIQEAKSVGRVGVKALVYFEFVSTLALLIGIVVGMLWRPGAGFSAEITADQAAQAKCYAETAAKLNPVDYILHIIPDSVVGAFVSSPEAAGCGPGRRIF